MAAARALSVVLLFATCVFSVATDDSCLADAQTPYTTSPEGATNCQALLQSGVRQATAHLVEVHAEEAATSASSIDPVPKAVQAKDDNYFRMTFRMMIQRANGFLGRI
jgi:hypothetical protein